MDLGDAETTFYLLTWTAGFLSSICRIILDSKYIRFVDYLAAGASGGFLAFGIVGILSRYDLDYRNHHGFYLGLAALLGLAGKEQDVLLKAVIDFVLKKLGIERKKDGEK